MATYALASDEMRIPTGMTFGDLRAFMSSFNTNQTALANHARCIAYASFMSGWSRSLLESLFWGLFAFNIVLLGIASSSHATSESIKQYVEPMIPSEVLDQLVELLLT